MASRFGVVDEEGIHELKELRPVPNVVLLPCRTQMNLARQWYDDSTAAVSNVEPKTVAPYVTYTNNAYYNPSNIFARARLV